LILTILCIISIYYDAKIKVNSGENSSVRKAFFHIMKSDIYKLTRSLNFCKREINEREINEREINERDINERVVDERVVDKDKVKYTFYILIENQKLT
jgi:hypothetical protein